MAIARNIDNGNLYVSRFDFEGITNDGLISIYNEDSELIDEITLPGLPEITGLYFSRSQDNTLYVTERSTK